MAMPVSPLKLQLFLVTRLFIATRRIIPSLGPEMTVLSLTTLLSEKPTKIPVPPLLTHKLFSMRVLSLAS